MPIVGCEPSCLLTLREEHPALLAGDERAQTVAKQTRLVEELLVEAIDDGSITLDPDADVSHRPIVFHGHCHQKALAGTAATVALLERIPQNCSYLAVHKLKPVGNGVALKTNL